MVPEAIQKFIEVFSKLPSIGPRLATRLAFYLSNLDDNNLQNLQLAIQGIQSLTRCERCFSLKDKDQKHCPICSDPERDPTIIAIIEKETDLLSLEKIGSFKGQYLILGELAEQGVFSPAQKLRLQHLKERINKELDGKAKEIIIAVNLNTFGDFTAALIKQEFKNLSEKISRLGRGIPTGGEIEFTDEETLRQAFERRL